MARPSGLLLLLAMLCAATSARANPDALWQLVHETCAPAEAAHGNPAPCAIVAYPQGEASGYAVLKDRVGASQFLVIPTVKITGIEDPAILAPDATNYFAAAWAARGLFLARLGRSLPHDAISLAINSPAGRSQNQLHIHIDCVAAEVRDTLLAHLAEIGDTWATLPAELDGHSYRARRLRASLAANNPFFLLAGDAAVGPSRIGRHTLVVVGATFADGANGFVLLDDNADAGLLDRANGEELQDHDCALAKLLPN